MQMNNNIEKKVLKKITPNTKDKKKIESTILQLKKKVNQEIIKKKIPISIELVGSIAKDTYLKNNLDIDLFLLFPISITKKEIAINSLSIGKKVLNNTEESYAEHPYIRGYFNEYKTEIVPCYKIEKASQKLTAVDRTPLHTEYIKRNLQEFQKQEVRLIKQFFKGIGCYGAEAEIEGFSGYLCEILILKFKFFINLIKYASKWNYGEKFTLINKKIPSFDSPLIFIDPVDNDRNVASAVSLDKFNLFVFACKQYLIKPRLTYFFPNKIPSWPLTKIKNELNKKNFYYVGIIFSKPDIIDENLFPQLRKATRSIWYNCKKYGYKIHDTTFNINNPKKQIIIIIKTEKEKLSKSYIHNGPPVKLKKNVKEFKNKWEKSPKVIIKPYEKNGRIFVEVEREYTDIIEFLKNQVKNLSMGKHLDEIIKKNYEVVGLEKLLNRNLKIFWTKYLDTKKSWEY